MSSELGFVSTGAFDDSEIADHVSYSDFGSGRVAAAGSRGHHQVAVGVKWKASGDW